MIVGLALLAGALGTLIALVLGDMDERSNR